MRETRVMLGLAMHSPNTPAYLRCDECKAALSFVISHITEAEQWEASLYQETFVHHLERFLQKVKSLAVGQLMAFGGGWNKTNGGHGVMHTIRRDGTDTYSFSTCNTGQGLTYHNASSRCFPKEKQNFFLCVRNIPRERIVDDFSWAHMLWGLRFEQLESNSDTVSCLAAILLWPYLTPKTDSLRGDSAAPQRRACLRLFRPSN